MNTLKYNVKNVIWEYANKPVYESSNEVEVKTWKIASTNIVGLTNRLVFLQTAFVIENSIENQIK